MKKLLLLVLLAITFNAASAQDYIFKKYSDHFSISKDGSGINIYGNDIKDNLGNYFLKASSPSLQSFIDSLRGTFVPYTGATGDVDLGTKNFSAGGRIQGGTFATIPGPSGHASLSIFNDRIQPINGSSINIDGQINAPGLNLAHSSGINFVVNENGASLYNTGGTTGLQVANSAFNKIGSLWTDHLQFNNNGLGLNIIAPSLTASRVINLPDASGTVALTSDLAAITGFVPYTGANADVDLGSHSLTTTGLTTATNGSGTLQLFGNRLNFSGGSSIAGLSSGNTGFYGNATFLTGGTGNNQIILRNNGIGFGTDGNVNLSLSLIAPTTNSNRTIAFPDASGTVALTSDLSALPSDNNVLHLNTTANASETVNHPAVFSKGFSLASNNNDIGTAPGTRFTFNGIADFNSAADFSGRVTVANGGGITWYSSGTNRYQWDWDINTDGSFAWWQHGTGTAAFNFLTTNHGEITDATGVKFAKVTDLPSVTGYIPYTGATTNVDLGVRNIISNQFQSGVQSLGNAHTFMDSGSIVAGSSNNSAIQLYGGAGSNAFLDYQLSGVHGLLKFDNITSGRTWQMPDNSGTVALASDLGEYLHLGSWNQNVTQSPGFLRGLNIGDNDNFTTLTIWRNSNIQLRNANYTWEMDSPDDSGNFGWWMHGSGTAAFRFLNSGSGEITDGAGVKFAKVTDVPSVTGFVPYSGATGDINLGSHGITAQGFTTTSFGGGTISASGNGITSTNSLNMQSANTINLVSNNQMGFKSVNDDEITFTNNAETKSINFMPNSNGFYFLGGGFRQNISFTTPTSTRNIVFPDASGTVALTSDLASYPTDASIVHKSGAETITGDKTFSGNNVYSGIDVHSGINYFSNQVQFNGQAFFTGGQSIQPGTQVTYASTDSGTLGDWHLSFDGTSFNHVFWTGAPSHNPVSGIFFTPANAGTITDYSGTKFAKAGSTSSNVILGDGTYAPYSPSSGGTVTAISSANSDIAVATGTSTPVLTLNNVNGVTKSYYDPTSSIQTQLNGKQATISGTGFVKASGSTISYDNTTYLPLTGGTITNTTAPQLTLAYDATHSLAFTISSVGAATITTSGNSFSFGSSILRANTLSNTSTSNNSSLALNVAGAVISSNKANADPVLTVNDLNASSTGLLQKWQFNSSNVATLDKNGLFTPVSIGSAVTVTTQAPGTNDNTIASMAALNAERSTAATLTNKILTTPKLTGYTVATLPAGSIGMEAYVTDAVAPTYLGTLTGGGTVVTPVFYNGTAWVAH